MTGLLLLSLSHYLKETAMNMAINRQQSPYFQFILAYLRGGTAGSNRNTKFKSFWETTIFFFTNNNYIFYTLPNNIQGFVILAVFKNYFLYQNISPLPSSGLTSHWFQLEIISMASCMHGKHTTTQLQAHILLHHSWLSQSMISTLNMGSNGCSLCIFWYMHININIYIWNKHDLVNL